MMLLQNPEIPLLDIFPKHLKDWTQKNTSISMFIAVLVTVAKRQKQPKYSPPPPSKTNVVLVESWYVTL